MKNKPYFLALVYAGIGAAVITAVVWLLSLISWSLVWVVLVATALPTCHKLSEEFKKSKYHDFIDFLEMKFKEENKSKQSRIE